MPKAYVETTVLTDALLKPGARSVAATSAIKKFEESQLPVYAVKEMKAGPLHHYVWLHGKLVTTGSWVQTLEQLRKMAMTPRRYWVSTAVEALEAAAQANQSVTLGDLVKKYGRMATDDVARCDRYRLSLRNIIMSCGAQEFNQQLATCRNWRPLSLPPNADIRVPIIFTTRVESRCDAAVQT